MVFVTHAIAQDASGPPVDLLAEGLTPLERNTIEQALELAAEAYEGRVLGTGESVWTHAVGTALIASSLRLDADTRIAALLFAGGEYIDDAAEQVASR
ncbi:MAG: HD domain-containing protein, partial [Azoarcus sp.]